MIVLTSKRDIPILFFLWRWKIASTKSIAVRYFYNTSDEVCYKRLMQLRKAGYIQSRRTHSDLKHVWQLSPKGYSVIKEMLPTLVQDGYKSEHISHDILVAAVHSGDWIKEEPEGVRLYTEQELRRYHRDFLPTWLPNESERRPDGYWDFRRGSNTRLVALEVEITQKSESDYTSIFSFYDDAQQIDSVLWIVKDKQLLRRICGILEQASGLRKVHNFALGSDVIEFGWRTLIVSGLGKGFSISRFLQPEAATDFHQPINKASTGLPLEEVSPFLNLQKSYKKTVASATYKIGETFD